jgi:hypothetical protein
VNPETSLRTAMPAGYVPAWVYFFEALDHVMLTAGCGLDAACADLAAACRDGAIEAKFADDDEAIPPASWERAGFVEGKIYRRGMGLADALIPLFPATGETAVFTPPGWTLDPNYRRVLLRREDVERLWPVPPESPTPTGLPGRPSKGKDLIESEFKRRCCAGEARHLWTMKRKRCARGT